MPMSATHSIFLKHSLLGMQAGELRLSPTPAGKQGRSEAGWYTNALPARIQGHPRAVSSGRQPSRHAGQSPWQPRVLSFRHP